MGDGDSSTDEKKSITPREQNVSLNSEAAMDEFLKGLNLYRKPIAKDGSCLFRAVSEHVYNTQEKHLDVRNECISYMKENKDHFSAFVAGSYEHHLFGLQNPKEWAGQVEIVALSFLYHRDFLIYQEVNQPPSNVTNHGFDKKIMLCFSNGNHYDCVYSNKFVEDASLIQSILYEFIYKSVLPECQRREEIKHQTDEANVAGDDNKNTWMDVKCKTSKNKKEDDQALTPDESVALWEIERSLDTSVYRNVALEIWEQSKLEQTQADRAIAMNLQFKTGEYCLALVGDSSTKGYLKAQIKDIIEDKYMVYVPELKETFYVFLECLKPLLVKPERPEQLTYDKLPGYYRKSEEQQKDFQYPKKRQPKGSNCRGYRDEDGRSKRGDARYDQRNDKVEGKFENREGRFENRERKFENRDGKFENREGKFENRDGKFENRNDLAHGGSRQRRDRRDRRGGQGSDRARYDRGDRRDNERKSSSFEKGGKKMDSQNNRSPNEEQKPYVVKKVEGSQGDKEEKVEEINKDVSQDTKNTNASTTEVEKEKSAKQDETPAAFWQRMRKPEVSPPVQMDGSKTALALKANPSPSDKRDSNIETIEASRLNSDVAGKQSIEHDSVSKNQLETKQGKSSENNDGKVHLKTARIVENTTKHVAAKQNGKPNPSKHNPNDKQFKKTEQKSKENSTVYESSNSMTTVSDDPVKVTSDQKPAIESEENYTKQSEINQSISASQVLNKDANTVLGIALMRENSPEEPCIMNQIPSEQSSPVQYPHKILNKASTDACQNNVVVEDDTRANNGHVDHNNELEQNDEADRVFEPSIQLSDAPYIEAQGNAVRPTDDYSPATNTFSVASEVFIPSDSVEFTGVYKSEQKGEQQKIRILTKGNEDQFKSVRDVSPEPESKKVQPKKVSFGKVVEFPEVSLETQTEFDVQEEGILPNPYSMSNGVPENDENLVYENASYVHAPAMQFMPMMMPAMMHGNEQIQIPQKFSMDPEGRDLPQHTPTVRYFFNLGLQFFMMQHQPPAFLNMQLPQMQAAATQMHSHAYSVHTSTHSQMPYRYGQAVEEVSQMKTDQQDDYQAPSLAKEPYDVSMAQKQQPYLQQRNFHTQNHQANSNQYEQPPRMRRGKGRGSNFAPSVPMNRNPVLHDGKIQPQPRIEKRNHNVTMGSQIPHPPPSYLR